MERENECGLRSSRHVSHSPPTILKNLEDACQKFQYGGNSANSGDSLHLFVWWKFLRFKIKTYLRLLA